MNDAELKKTFPFGVMVIPRTERDRSFAAKVGDDYEEDPSSFTVWDTPEHGTDLSRELVAENDGYVTKAAHGAKEFFLRPLTKEQKVTF